MAYHFKENNFELWTQWILKKFTTMMLLGFWTCPQTEKKILDNFGELVTGEMKRVSEKSKGWFFRKNQRVSPIFRLIGEKYHQLLAFFWWNFPEKGCMCLWAGCNASLLGAGCELHMGQAVNNQLKITLIFWDSNPKQKI